MMKKIKIYNKHVAFWGSPFSNFYKCSFVEKGIVWKSSEQCFMAKKAEFFEDFETYDLILESKTPKEAKELGRQVKNFDANKWLKVCFEKMYEACFAKFSQNENLKTLILSEDFNGKKFVEGSPIDSIWGVKMDWENPEIDNEENWKGQNLLGKVLDKIRKELKNEKETYKRI